MEQYWDCSLCVVEDKGEAFRCKACCGKLRGRDRLLMEMASARKTRRRGALLSGFAPGLGQICSRRWATGVVLAVLIPLAFGLAIVTWKGFTYGHVFLIAAAVFVAFVAVVDARLGPKRARAPCQQTCPADLDVPDYLQLILDAEMEQGFSLIRTKVPFVDVIGRICPHPCETRCARGIDGEPIAINACKRFLADRNREGIREEAPGKSGMARPHWGGVNVGVIGSGPAGAACAYYLRVLGAVVTVYDARSVPGGQLGNVLPDYRLPRSVLHREMEDLQSRGVTFRLDTRVGPGGIPLEALMKEHAAVFVAVGAENSLRLGVPGAEAFLDFQEVLQAAKLGRPLELGLRVAVVGGGNAALDAARTALRVGAEEVHVLYRRTRDEMPARDDEIEESLREGVRFHFLADPVRAKIREGRIDSLCVRKMELGAPDASGRPRPVPVEGEEWELEVDSVIPALGQSVGGGVLDDPALAGLRREPDGRIWVEPETQRTNLRRIYAGGDAVTGAATAVQAVAQGRRAALALYAELAPQEISGLRLTDRRRRKPFRRHVETPQVKIREEIPKLSIRARRGTFREVEEGLEEASACREAGRCLQCHREL